VTAASGLRHFDLDMTQRSYRKVHMQSNGRRTAVESKSNRSCNHRVTVAWTSKIRSCNVCQILCLVIKQQAETVKCRQYWRDLKSTVWRIGYIKGLRSLASTYESCWVSLNYVRIAAVTVTQIHTHLPQPHPENIYFVPLYILPRILWG